MKLVIDTNILISGYLRDGVPETVLMYVIANHVTWLVTPDILLEYKAVLSRPKFKVSQKDLRVWDALFHTYTHVILPTESVLFLRDEKDSKFLTCAHSGGADFLITGDSDFESASLLKTEIVSASAFKSRVIDRASV